MQNLASVGKWAAGLNNATGIDPAGRRGLWRLCFDVRTRKQFHTLHVFPSSSCFYRSRDGRIRIGQQQRTPSSESDHNLATPSRCRHNGYARISRTFNTCPPYSSTLVFYSSSKWNVLPNSSSLITLNPRTKTPLWATTDEEDLLARVVKGSGSATKLSLGSCNA